MPIIIPQDMPAFATLEKEMVGKRQRSSLVVLKCLLEQAPLGSAAFLLSTEG